MSTALVRYGDPGPIAIIGWDQAHTKVSRRRPTRYYVAWFYGRQMQYCVRYDLIPGTRFALWSMAEGIAWAGDVRQPFAIKRPTGTLPEDPVAPPEPTPTGSASGV